MSVDTLSPSEDAGIISRLQLAKALKEDPENIYAESPENSAIFLRLRNRNTKFGVQTPPRGAFRLPRPINLLVPPVLGNVEEYNSQHNASQILPSQQYQQAQQTQQTQQVQQNQQVQQEVRRPSLPQISTPSPRNSVVIPEERERRGSGSKPATLLDVRESMLEVRHNLQNTLPFTASSSHRTSMILQQNKTLPDANGKPHGSSRLNTVTASRPNSVVSPSRPISSYSNNAANSRPTSFYKSNKPSNPQDFEEDEDENEKESSSANSKNSKNSKSKSQKSGEIKKNGSSSSDDSDSAPKQPPLLPPIKSVTNQSISLEKVEEEDDSSEESEDDDDDDDESSEDDTPLALKSTPSTPRIKVASPRIITKKNNGGRIEAWLEHVSGSPEGIPSRPSTPSHSPTPPHSPHSPHSPRVRKISEHSQYSSSPLGMGHRMSSYMGEPNHDARNHRPKSAYIPEDLQPPKPEFYQPRKRSNSEFAPKKRPISVMHEVPLPVGRVSPSPRQDSGYWAKDTLLALSDDMRHMSIMNESNTLYSRTRSASFSNSSGSNNGAKLSPANNTSKVMNRHRREGSGSSVHNSRPNTPQLQIPPIVKPSRSRDSLQTPPMSPYSPSAMNGNRNSFYANNQRISSEQLKASNRNSVYLYQHQQKNRIRS